MAENLQKSLHSVTFHTQEWCIKSAHWYQDMNMISEFVMSSTQHMKYTKRKIEFCLKFV